MGYGSGWSPAQIAAFEAAKHKKATALERVRMLLANKIVLMLTKEVEDKIIRPGPVQAERECYEMAQELRDIIPELAKLVSEILRVEGTP